MFVLSIMYYVLSRKYPIYVLLLVISYLLFVSAPALAQEPLSFTISPPNQEHVLNPGEQAEGKLQVINNTSYPLTFTISVQDFTVEDTKGTVSLVTGENAQKRFAASSWIAVSPTVFTLESHEDQSLKYFIQVPSNAQPGGHYAAVVFTPVNPGKLQTTGATVQANAGTLFYITVNGDLRHRLQIKSLTANSFQEYGPVNLIAQITNLGDVHAKPVGTITLSDMFGRKVATQALFEQNIFPGASREYTNTLGPKLMIGRFSAQLLVQSASNDSPLVASVYLWIFPWKAVVIVILGIITTILAFIYWWQSSNAKFKVQNAKLQSKVQNYEQ